MDDGRFRDYVQDVEIIDNGSSKMGARRKQNIYLPVNWRSIFLPTQVSLNKLQNNYVCNLLGQAKDQIIDEEVG